MRTFPFHLDRRTFIRFEYLRGEGRIPLACRFLLSKEGNMNLEELLAVPFRFPWVTGSDRSFVLVSIYLLEIMLSNTYYYYY